MRNKGVSVGERLIERERRQRERERERERETRKQV